jgi:hypothetical protein
MKMSKNIYNNFENEKTCFNKASHSNCLDNIESLKSSEKPNNFDITDVIGQIINNKQFKDFKPKNSSHIKLNINAKVFVHSKNRLKKEEKKEESQIYSFEFLMKYENMEISNKTDLLSKDVLNHIDSFKIVVKYEQKFFENGKKSEKWEKKDFAKEEKVAEENIKKLYESDNKDKDIKELREIMNIMTKNNYDEKKDIILKIIKDDEKLQEQFIKKVLFKKAVMEMPFAELYSELAKFLNKKLPQKSKKSEKSSLFREILIDECKKVLKTTNFDEYINEEDQQEKEMKIKKFYKGNMNLVIQLVKVKLQSKRAVEDSFEFLLKRYKNEESKFFKTMLAETILLLVDKFGTFINTEKEKVKDDDVKKYNKKVDEFIQNLEEIKNDKALPGHIKFNIINLIEKRKNKYKESKFEKSLRVYSKEELERELVKEDDRTEVDTAEAEEECKEREQEEIIEKIKSDLSEYKECVEEEGDSKKFTWKTTTILYDVEFKSIEDITQGYLAASADFIEKEDNIKYAKDYIRELFNYYNEKMDDKEKDDLIKRVFSLYGLVKDYSYETPKIYEIYAYLLFTFMENDIMEVEDIQDLLKGKESEDLKVLSGVLQNIYTYNKSDEFKSELKTIPFISKNKGEFEWVF